MSSRMRVPETKRLEISQGDWLLVKKHLTAGESRRMFKMMTCIGPDGDQHADHSLYGYALAVTYLMDWSFTDPSGKRIEISEKSPEDVGAALDSIDTDSFTEVVDAIEVHHAAMKAERAAEKNALTTGSKSLAISGSPADLVGSTTGSLNSL